MAGHPRPSFPRLAGRLYFFPALLSLAEVAPWLLGLLGAVTGAAGCAAVLQKHKNLIRVASLLLILLGGLCWYVEQPDKAVREEGTQLIARAAWPVAKKAGAVPAGPLPAAQKFSELWVTSVPLQILATPVITGDEIIYGSYSGSVEALARKDGTPLWSLPQSAYVFAVGLGSDGKVYAGTGLHQTQSATMTAIEPEDGRVIWAREFLGHIENAPLMDAGAGRLWLGAGPGGLWAVDARNGDVLWHGAIGHMDSTPLLAGDILYAPAQPANGASALYALDAESGRKIWQAPLQGQPWGTPALNKAGDTILITSGIGQIGVVKPTDKGWAQAVRVSDGALLWQKELPNMAIQPDVYLADDDVIIYALKNGELLALRGATGDEVWRVKAGNEFQSGATRLAGAGAALIAATTYDGVFTIRRARDGVEVARRKVGGYASSSPVSEGDTVYVTTAWSVTAFGGVSSLRGAP